MSFALIEVPLSADILASGTLTLAYPSGDAAADFDTAADHKATYNGVVYSASASDFSLTFNAGDITFTNGASNVTLAAGRVLRVQAEKDETAAAGNFFDVIEAADSSLGINGQDAAQGGEVVVKGGTSSTAANAGGAVGQTGGAPGATGVGGAVSDTGGAGGATSGVGGAVDQTGGVGTAGNSAGGAASSVGGAGQGSAAGGASSVKGGLAGATGAGGAASVVGGAGGATSGVGGAASVVGGAGTANNDDGGAVTLAGGAPHGSGTKGVVNVNGAIRNTTNIGSVPATVTAVEHGDGFNHVTVLTVTAAVLVPDIPADAEEVGALIYTFPAGVHQVHSVHMKITAIVEGANSNAVDIGCGSTLAAGDGATLQAATDEDFLDGQTIADSSSPAIEKSLAADGTVFESGDSKLFHINLGGTWTATEADPSITGTVTIRWSFLGV